MAFWSDHRITPKQQHKYVLIIGGTQALTAKTVDKPKATVENKRLRMINHYYRYPGLLTWEPITVTFVDMAGDHESGLRETSLNTAMYLRDMLAKSGYQTPNNDGITSIEKASSIAKAFGLVSRTPAEALTPAGAGAAEGDSILKIQQIDSSGKKVVEEWTLVNPIISKIDWGQLDYSSADTVEYSLTIEYDYALFREGHEVIKTGLETISPYTDF